MSDGNPAGYVGDAFVPGRVNLMARDPSGWGYLAIIRTLPPGGNLFWDKLYGNGFGEAKEWPRAARIDPRYDARHAMGSSDNFWVRKGASDDDLKRVDRQPCSKMSISSTAAV